MKIFYRGYVIDEEIRSISYSVYGQRPKRSELTVKGTSHEAMEWIDDEVRRNTILAVTMTPASAIYQAA